MPDPNGDITSPEEGFLPPDHAVTTDPEASSQAPSIEGITPTDELDDGVNRIEFDEKHRLDYEGLLYIGALTHTFTYAGHKFKIRTLNTDEILEVGLLTKEYAGTMSSERAFVTAMVAGALVAVDGKPLPQPISRDSADTRLANQFEFVKSNYFPQVVDFVYQCVLVLEARVDEILVAMGEASGQTD